MKKLFLLSAFCFLLSVNHAFAQGGTTGPLTWSLSNDTLTISGEGEMPNYGDYFGAFSPWFDYRKLINSVVIENGVISIGDCAFWSCTNLTSITIANSVTRMGDQAFAYCKSLTEIEIPDSIQKIERLTFYRCTGLSSINIPYGVVTIENSAFEECVNLTSINLPNSLINIEFWAFYACTSLTSITLPENITNIGAAAFSYCTSLASIFIPKSVTNIGSSIFSNCTSLTAIEVESENIVFASEEGILFNKSKTTLICYPAGKTTKEYIIPDNVTSIGRSAFSSCANLTSVTIHNGISSIGSSAFSECSGLVSITLPNSITSIENSTFSRCTALASIYIPESVKRIDTYAFYYCKSLTLITNLNPVPVNINFDVFFDGVNMRTCTLEVPINSVEAYKKANVWKEFNIVGIEVGIVETDDYPSLQSLRLCSRYPVPGEE